MAWMPRGTGFSSGSPHSTWRFRQSGRARPLRQGYGGHGRSAPAATESPPSLSLAPFRASRLSHPDLMKLIDLNADGGIGANSLYVQIGDFHLVVDSGLHPKKVGRVAAPNLRPLQGVKLDLILITH